MGGHRIRGPMGTIRNPRSQRAPRLFAAQSHLCTHNTVTALRGDPQTGDARAVFTGWGAIWFGHPLCTGNCADDRGRRMRRPYQSQEVP